MAEGLAGKMLGQETRVESAGLAPSFEGPQPEAVDVMKDLYGVDISEYGTQDVFELPLNKYDWIIVLDAHVNEILKDRFPTLGEHLILWDIDDPYGRPRRAYKQTVRLIEYCIKKFLLGERES